MTETSTSNSSESQQRRRDRRDGIRPWWGLAVGLLIGSLFFAIPLYASVSYRLAVGSLHAELGAIEIGSAELVDEYVSSCFEDLAPASVRVFRPIGEAHVADVRSDYAAALQQRGFSEGTMRAEEVWSRERRDSLDGDGVRLRIDESANTLTVVSDAYDIDMVACLPLTGRS